MTGNGVACFKIAKESRQLKAGSNVLIVWLSDMATAANETLAAMCPRACIVADPVIFSNSSLFIG